MNARKLMKTVFYPLVLVRRGMLAFLKYWYGEHNPRKLAGLIYYLSFRKCLNWKNPQTLNEKINWLKFYSDTTVWSRLADKYLVRDYLQGKGLGHILVKLYGV